MIHSPWTLAKLATRRGSGARPSPHVPFEPSSDVPLDPVEDAITSEPSTSILVCEVPILASRSARNQISCNAGVTEQQPSERARKRSSNDMEHELNGPYDAASTAEEQFPSRSQKVSKMISWPNKLRSNALRAKETTADATLCRDQERSKAQQRSLIDDGVAGDAALRKHPGLYPKALHTKSSMHPKQARQTRKEHLLEAGTIIQAGGANTHSIQFSPHKKLLLETTDTADQVQRLRTRLSVDWHSICEEASRHAHGALQKHESRCRLGASDTDVLVPIGCLSGSLQLIKAMSKNNAMSALFVHKQSSERASQRSDSISETDNANQMDTTSLVRLWHR